jgi:hypothetical protein
LDELRRLKAIAHTDLISISTFRSETTKKQSSVPTLDVSQRGGQ